MKFIEQTYILKPYLWAKTFYSLIAKSNMSFYQADFNNNIFSFNWPKHKHCIRT